MEPGNQQQFLQAAAAMLQQQRMPFAFQPLYNHSSMMSMPHPMRHQQHQGYMHPNQGHAPQRQYQQAPLPQNVETEVEITQSEDVDHVAEALQTNPHFLKTVDESAVSTSEPNVFQIDQEMYPLAAWKRIDARVANSQQYKQWFNYGMGPKTFASYAAQQRTVQKNLGSALAKNLT
jgi:hypothetical protein